MKAIVIPVKSPANAKTRLSGLLGPVERQRLATVMFADVARALSGVRLAHRVFVVTNDRPACEQATLLGFDVLIEESQHSESASVDWASRELEARGYDLVMRLPADIPMVTAADIDSLLEMELKRPGALMVPSREGTGTNTIVRRPPTLFRSHFGPDSLRLHSDEAALLGVEPVIVANDRIGLDIDEPGDLATLLECGRGTETYSFISEAGIATALISARSSAT
jgi:2-phospho-L-lactate/phosphoenolpyruvate guanylyltransferase